MEHDLSLVKINEDVTVLCAIIPTTVALCTRVLYVAVCLSVHGGRRLPAGRPKPCARGTPQITPVETPLMQCFLMPSLPPPLVSRITCKYTWAYNIAWMALRARRRRGRCTRFRRLTFPGQRSMPRGPPARLRTSSTASNSSRRRACRASRGPASGKRRALTTSGERLVLFIVAAPWCDTCWTGDPNLFLCVTEI